MTKFCSIYCLFIFLFSISAKHLRFFVSFQFYIFLAISDTKFCQVYTSVLITSACPSVLFLLGKDFSSWHYIRFWIPNLSRAELRTAQATASRWCATRSPRACYMRSSGAVATALFTRSRRRRTPRVPRRLPACPSLASFTSSTFVVTFDELAKSSRPLVFTNDLRQVCDVSATLWYYVSWRLWNTHGEFQGN